MIEYPLLNRNPLGVRREIPLFAEKTEMEVRDDRYELYWEVVVRQLLLHYADHCGGVYRFKPILDFTIEALPKSFSGPILEVGGGVGRLSAELAQAFPQAPVAMVDYAYNMLRAAHDLWLAGNELALDGRHLGLGKHTIQTGQLANLWLGQAKGEDLPFRDDGFAAVVSSFFLDRAADLQQAVQEQWRVLREGGLLIAVTPLNFQHRRQWEKFGEPEKISSLFESLGLRIRQFEPELLCREQLDGRGNLIHWRAAAWVLEKGRLFPLRKP